MKSPLTIVIPVFNRADLVQRTLRSVEAQTYRPLSVVLVDNNSTDGTLDVLRRWADAVTTSDFDVRVISEPAPGASAARNAGLAAVETEWTAFFDSDDEMLPDHIEQAMRGLSACPDADIIGWQRKIMRLDGSVRYRGFHVRHPIYNNLIHSSFATPDYMCRTALLRRVGGWDTSLSVNDDVALGQRLLLTNPRLHSTGHCSVVVHEQPASITYSSGRLEAAERSYAGMGADLAPRMRHWTDLRMLIYTASDGAADPAASAVAARIIASRPRLSRWWWRLLYRYTLLGGRGAGRIYGLFARGLK